MAKKSDSKKRKDTLMKILIPTLSVFAVGVYVAVSILANGQQIASTSYTAEPTVNPDPCVEYAKKIVAYGYADKYVALDNGVSLSVNTNDEDNYGVMQVYVKNRLVCFSLSLSSPQYQSYDNSEIGALLDSITNDEAKKTTELLCDIITDFVSALPNVSITDSFDSQLNHALTDVLKNGKKASDAIICGIYIIRITTDDGMLCVTAEP